MMRLRKINEVIGLPVYTDAGDLVGEVDDLSISENKVDSWKIKVSRTSTLANHLGGAKGIVVPHQFVKAVGDIIIISKAIAPVSKEEKSEEEFE